MALFFRNYLGKFALLTVIALLASCSDADKNADKFPEQEHTKIEHSADSKNGTHKLHYLHNLDANGILIKVFKDYSVDALVYNDDAEKIAQIIRKETKSFIKINAVS